jgi:lysophospholipase L1-like esterase
MKLQSTSVMTSIWRVALCALMAAANAFSADDRPVEDAAKMGLEKVTTQTLPTVWLVGDSTVKNGTKGQRGWGEVVGGYFDATKINVVNRAIGGRSSRTFITEGRWAKIVEELKAGDVVLVQFGHNDGGPVFKPKARASLKGIGEDVQTGIVEQTGKEETVHSYGWYIRTYIADAKAKGATVIVCSLVPRKIWVSEGKLTRGSADYGLWAKQAAAQGGALFVDLNEIVARRYEQLGAAKVDTLFADAHTHTNEEGGQLNAECVIAGLKALKLNPLEAFFSAKAAAVNAAVLE